METKYPFTPWLSLAPYRRLITLQDGTIFYYDCKPKGYIKQTLVLIHGLGDEADSWRHIIPLLNAKGYRCIALDLPGFGRSVWNGKISVSRHADAVIQVMNDCGIAGNEITDPAVLVGNSMGAGVAEITAIKRPDLVQSLILVDGCFPIHFSINLGFMLFGLIGKKWYRNFKKNHEGAWKSLYPFYHNLDVMNDADKTFLRERVIARVESSNQEQGYFESIRSMASTFAFGKPSLKYKIKKFNGKILIIWGEHDHTIPVDKSAPFRRLRRDAVFKTITGTGHLPHQENPAEVVGVILEFLG